MTCNKAIKIAIIAFLASVCAFSVDAETFTIYYKDIYGNPQDQQDFYGWIGFDFLDISGANVLIFDYPNYLSNKYYIAGGVGSVTLTPRMDSTGAYDLEFDPGLFPPGEYYVAVWCYDFDTWDYPWTMVYKRMNIQPGGSGTIDCSGDEDIKRVNLIVTYDDGEPYFGSMTAVWLKESSGFSENKYSMDAIEGSLVTLNQGEHMITLSDVAAASPQYITVGGGDVVMGLPYSEEIPIEFPRPSADLTIELTDNGIPVGGSTVRVFKAGESKIYYYGWTDYEGKLVMTDKFVPGDYLAMACCPLPDRSIIPYCDFFSSYIYRTYQTAAFSMEAEDSKTLRIECSVSYDVDVKVQFTDGTPVDAGGYVYTCHDPPACTSRNVAGYIRTDSEGMGSISIPDGDYQIDILFAGLTAVSDVFTVSGAPPPGPVVINFPEPPATVTVNVMNGFTGDPLSNIGVSFSTPAPNRVFVGHGYTDEGGQLIKKMSYGTYIVGVACPFSLGTSYSSPKDTFVVDETSPSATIDFGCFGSEMHVFVVDEYEPDRTRPLELSDYQQSNTRVTLKDYLSGFRMSGSNLPAKFNVTPGLYELDASVFYLIYPLTSECLRPDPDTGFCNRYYSTAYAGVDGAGIEAKSGEVVYAYIPFKTYLFNDPNYDPNDPAYDPFGNMMIVYPTYSVSATDFEPSLLFLALSAVCISVLLAFLSCKRIKP